MAGKQANKEKGKKPEKIVITPELRRIWLTSRRAWVTSFQAFSYSLSSLNEQQAELLYNVVKLGLFRNSYVDILREHPELKEIVKSDDDRMCMIDIYEVLSWRLGKHEELPPEVKLTQRIKGRLGREVPDLSQ